MISVTQPTRTSDSRAVFLQAFQEFKVGHYASCVDDLLKLSDAGDAKASYILAVIFDKGGNGVTQDIQRAKELYALSLQQSPIPGAGIALAQILCAGRGGTTDFAAAKRYCDMFPYTGYAVVMLGLMKYHGSGCPKDYDAALLLFDRAWSLGHPLGLKYAAIVRMSKREYFRASSDFIRSALLIVWYYGIRKYPLTKSPRDKVSTIL